MIDAVELQNFKAFREERFELGSFTLLTGLNGTGKSSVLQSLSVLRQSWDAGTLREDGLLLNGELVALGTGRDVLHEDYRQSSRGEPEISIALEDGDSTDDWLIQYEKDADLLRIIEGPQGEARSALFAPGFQYIRADRVSPSLTYPRSYDATVRRGTLGPRGEHTANYIRTNSELTVSTKRRHPESEHSALIDQVGAWMQDLCPGVNVAAHHIDGTDSVRLDYGFFGTAGFEASNRFRPTNVGFGLTYVLPVIVACLTAPPGATLLLENPEAHLHPRGQTALAKLCAGAVSDRVQIIVESHSDHFLNGIRLSVRSQLIEAEDTSVLFFSRSGYEAASIQRPEIGGSGALSFWPEGFFDEWDQALGKLLG